MVAKTIVKKIDPDKQQFEEVPVRLGALEEAISDLQSGGSQELSDRLRQAEASIQRLEQLLFHHHRQRPNQLNYVDKPVLIKDGSFIDLHDGSNASR